MSHRQLYIDNTSHQPHPQVVAHKLLGGVDQATLRQSISRGDSDQLVDTDTCSDTAVHHIMMYTIGMHLMGKFGHSQMMCYN